jgi:Cysteine-rich secretory protein family
MLIEVGSTAAPVSLTSPLPDRPFLPIRPGSAADQERSTLRQLARVVVATSALLGALAVASPAAAETAEQCHAAINQYRAKAGLDKASSTSIKALAVAAGKHAAYRVNVDPGDSILLTDLGLPDLGLFGPDLNAHLETPSLVSLGFTGVNPWDRTRAAKLADGTWRYQYEDVTTASGIPAANLQGVRSWIDAPYHRLPLLDANTRHVGCAASQRQVGATVYSAEVLEMAATWKDTTKRITLYPAPGQTGVPTSFNRCQEHPTPFGGRCDPARPVQPVGYMVTVQAGGYHAMKIQGIAFSKGSARTPVGIHRAVRYRTTKSTVASSSVDTNLPANAAMLAATAPLAAKTTYNVRVSGYVQAAKGGTWVQFRTRIWSFTTA